MSTRHGAEAAAGLLSSAFCQSKEAPGPAATSSVQLFKLIWVFSTDAPSDPSDPTDPTDRSPGPPRNDNI
jgi:hypothetical protein